MRKAKSCAFLLTLILALALLIMPFGALSVSASESTDKQVTATTSASVKQGNSGYCYVYIDSLESLSTLSVTVHYDADKVSVQSGYVYNSVSSLLNDKSVSESSVQFSYIFDGKGKAEKTQLFYFRYTVLSDAEVGDTYFDIVVNEAYDSSLQPKNVSGSRCAFKVAETVTTKTCSIYSSSSVSTSVGEEFEISYRLSTYQIASGSFTVGYDPELFEVVGVTNGAFCDNKIVDVNTKLAGSVYVSFVGTEYNYNTNLITVKFKTLKNMAEKSTIKMTVTEFYDLALNPISCSGYTTTANIAFDETYTVDAPSMTLQTAYNAQTDKVTLTVNLDRDSMLGAGDFVLKFNTNYLTYNSAEKGFSPTFFNINDKNVSDGILKFSIISLSNITDEQIILTVTFDVKHACEDKLVDFEISGSGLTDALTNTIVLNFVDASVTIPLKHTAATATTENRVEPTCTADGRCDSVVYCSVCDAELSRENKVIDKLGHDYSTEWTVDLKPTCTTEGSKSHHCSRCDDKADITVIPANGHSFGDWYVTNDPTESIQGEKRRDCSNCSAYETSAIAVLEHDHSRWETIILEAKAPTCTLSGLTQGSKCSKCGEILIPQNTIAANGHSYGDWYTVDAPTCTDEGSDEHECSVCHNKESRTVDALGHTSASAVVENKTEATCTANGSYNSVVYCSVCSAELSRETKTIDKLGHNYETKWTTDVEPTCTTVGSKSHHCTRCGDKADITEIPANGHSYGDWYTVIAPTCTEEGTDEHECSVCNNKETRTTDAKGHTNAEAVVENKVEATCTVDGKYESVIYCSTCDDELSRESKVINKLGHNYSTEWTIDIQPTCTTVGSKSHHCTECGDKVDVTELSIIPHPYGEWYEIIAPTCTTTGTDEHKCSVCQHTETRTVDALGHNRSDAVEENKTNATCTENGSYESVIYCSVCETELERETITNEKLGHNYSNEWTEDIAPTCTTVGSKSHHCLRCDDKVDVTEIPVNGHSYGGWYEIQAPTCTAMGTDEHKCSVCQHTETKETTALGHKEANAVEENKNAATCTSDGSYDSVIYCLTCGDELSRETKIIDKLGHDYSDEWTVDIAPTCTTVGSKSHHCTRCGNMADVTEVSANGHSYGEWYETHAPTCIATGTDEHECSVCHNKETRTTDAKGHTNSEVVVENKVDATCTADGSYDSVIYCSVCNTELSREAKTDSMLGHDYSNEWTTDVEPTCTTVGSKSHHCTRCDDKSDVTEVPANGHSYLTDFVFDEENHWKECACGEKADTAVHTWDNGVATKEATVDDEGVKTYTCTYCSITKTESIPKIVINIEDTDSGVTLEIPSNSQATLPAGTVIDVVDKSNEQVSDEILDELATTEETIVETLGVYDLNLLLDGVKIQPNGAVVVTLPAPKLNAEFDRIIVVYIAPNGGYEECKTTVNADGSISFETDHFSKYAVIGINEEESDGGLGIGAIIAIIVGALLVVGAGGFAIYWFVIKKKANPTEEIATDTNEASNDASDEEQK